MTDGINTFDFLNADEEASKIMLSGEEIIYNLTNDQVRQIVVSLGAEQYEETERYMVFPTICHNLEGGSMKLYYYYDRKIFVCYTECGDAFNIFTLVQRVKELHGEKADYYSAKDYILNFLELGTIVSKPEEYVPIGDQYRRHIQANVLPEYNSQILDMFLTTPYVAWINEGMTPKAIHNFNIRYSITKNAVVIPHYDINDRLIGIRVRNLDYFKGGGLAKYCPLILERKMYNHPLLLNLYGLNRTKRGIDSSGIVVVFESEKSVILGDSYYGEDNNFVAVCGSNISKPQVDLLFRNCRVKEMVIAFDKEYEEYCSKKADDYFNKLYDMGAQYTNYFNVSFIFDKEGLLKEKDSPIDRGSEVFKKLFANRVRIRR